MSVAELRRVLLVLRESDARLEQGLHWSRFRRRHQAGARRCHQARRARQAPCLDQHTPAALTLPTMPALTEAQWVQIAPLLLPQKSAVGRPAGDHRLLVEGIVFEMRTGCSWRDLPERFGPWQTVVGRYRRWCQQGVWARVLPLLQTQEVPIASSA